MTKINVLCTGNKPNGVDCKTLTYFMHDGFNSWNNYIFEDLSGFESFV